LQTTLVVAALDIAGPSFLESSKPWLDAGRSGFGVRTLVEVAARERNTNPDYSSAVK
jgi:leucyl aminopeptidase